MPQPLRKQEGVEDGRKYLATEGIAKGYCKKLESLLRNYSDKAHGLTDAQEIEAQMCFERLAQSPGASLSAAVEMYLTHREQAQRSVTLWELGEKNEFLAQTSRSDRSFLPERVSSGQIADGFWNGFLPDKTASLTRG